MILATHGIVGSQIGQVDSDYQAVLDYATTQGYTLPSASQKLLQEQLIKDLKTAGIWSKLDTFAVFATDGNSDFALIDWIRLTDYTAVNSPTFTTNEGFTGNGSSSYIDTNNSLDSGTNFDASVPSASFGGWSFFNKGATSNVLCGGGAGINRVRGGLSYITSSVLVPSLLTSGLYHLNTNTTQATLYINSSVDGNTTNNTTIDSSNFKALADSSGFSLDTISILFSGGDLSSESLDLYNACNTYISAL